MKLDTNMKHVLLNHLQEHLHMKSAIYKNVCFSKERPSLRGSLTGSVMYTLQIISPSQVTSNSDKDYTVMFKQHVYCYFAHI